MMIVSVDCYWYKLIILNALALKYQGNEAGNASKWFFNMRLSPILMRQRGSLGALKYSKVKYARVRVRRSTSLVEKPSKPRLFFLPSPRLLVPLVLFLLS